MTVEDITAQWVTSALRSSGVPVTVTDCEHTAVIGGNATKVRMRVSYSTDDGAASDLPVSLCAKIGMELQDPTLNLTGSTYDVEGRFYATVAPQLPGLPIPRCVAVIIDEASHRCALIMEDLIDQGATFGNPLTTTLNPDQLERLLVDLARIHARWWQGRNSMPLDHLEHGISDTNRLGRYYRTFDVPHVMGLLDGPRGHAIPREISDPTRLVDTFWRYAAFTTQAPTCVIHADPHLANIYIRPDGSCGIADWQTLRWGPWSHDVAYLITSALSIAERRANDRDLLTAYTTALKASGADVPDADVAYAAFSRSLIYGLFGWLTAPAYFAYSEEFSSCYANKFAVAAIDHGTFERPHP